MPYLKLWQNGSLFVQVFTNRSHSDFRYKRDGGLTPLPKHTTHVGRDARGELGRRNTRSLLLINPLRGSRINGSPLAFSQCDEGVECEDADYGEPEKRNLQAGEFPSLPAEERADAD